MRKAGLLLTGFLVLAGCQKQYEQNPDLNHTHADFAVWVNGQQVDFSDPIYMSGLSTDDATHDEEHEHLHPYYHLHDEVGHVIHEHKPGLPLKEFFDSLGYSFPGNMRMFVTNPAAKNTEWKEMPFNLEYEFTDMDMILFTNSTDDAAVTSQKNQMTEDACKYSQTCPWKGEPPAENCIADPAVPCVAPEDDL